jgi:tetratricopeptide (TPR) repeat protein
MRVLLLVVGLVIWSRRDGMTAQGDLKASTNSGHIGARYEVAALLGRGGMATVYRVTDRTTQRSMALKQLSMPDDLSRRKEMVALFEREFHALAELSHPRVIEVYDYGVDETAPYYTMELLDGGDLRERSPMPWRDACALLSGVCSSLALIHSRRLVHRDVSPANIWCTRDGEAKLIDFGALTSMGKARSVVGTAAFVAPEVIQQGALDGRTDLFSFGATLYFALTGRPPYPARSFSQLADLWTVTLLPPSSLVENIPEALDALVMSLLCLEPAMRPRSAFEVIQRLSAIAGVERIEPISVSQAYLSTPVLVGRQEAMRVLRGQMRSAFAGRGRGVLVEGRSGVGRSRALDACVVEAKMLGATILRASAGTARTDGFSVAEVLAEQLLELLPEVASASARASGAIQVLFEPASAPTLDGSSRPRLKGLAESNVPRLERQKALSDWFLHVAETHPLAVAVDDAHGIDEPSAALLAVLASKARKHRLLVAATTETGAPQVAPAALEVMAGCSTRIPLSPLTQDQTEELFGSLFGDVPNLGAVSRGVYSVAGGNPRACIDLAKHLIDRAVITYDGGGWTLPVRLDPSDLPSTVEDAIRDRIAALPPLALFLAEAQALANDNLGREDYRLICPEVDPHQIDRAVSELVSNHVLVSNGRLFSLAHRTWSSALVSGLTPARREERHRALASFYNERQPLAAVRHLLAGGQLERGLDRLADLFKIAGDASILSGADRMTGEELSSTIESALAAARTLQRPPREICELQRWLMAYSVVSEDALYWRSAPEWLAQLKRDSGFLDWESLAGVEPGERLGRAFGMAAQRYAETPEGERVCRPDEAIKWLCHYVVVSIAIGSRSMDLPLLESLPGLLEPFAPVSPVVDVIRRNAFGTVESRSRGHVEEARATWLDVYERLGKMSIEEVPYRDVLRNAIAFAIGSVEVRMGLESASQWAAQLENDELQQVSGLYIRKIAALQLGDADSAERYHKRAEVLALQARIRQMFTTTLPSELSAHALAGDLTGVKQVMARIRPIAETCLGWRPYVDLAEGQYQQLRGNLEAARAAFERCLALTSPDPGGAVRPVVIWPAAVVGFIEVLLGLGQYEEARVFGEQALAICRALKIGLLSHEISRALAMAEGRLNLHPQAVARLDAVIAEQRRLGVTGLMIGASYEARARIAIWAGDDAALAEYATLTAKEYRHGRGSPLGARWERLMAEARRASNRALPRLADFESNKVWTGRASTSATEIVSEFLRDAATAQDRAARTLKLLCDDRGATSGHLYLVGDTGLMLVASQASVAAPEGLLEYLTKYFEDQVSESGDQTTALSASQMGTALEARPAFHDAAGNDHYPVLMTSLTVGEACHAGVAVFVGSQRSERPVGGVALVAALSTHLIQSGDTRGVAA